jgi:type IV pilus assembly protein PilM
MFSRKENDLIGLDIGSHSIKLAQIKSIKNSYHLINFDFVRLPGDLIISDSIMNISNLGIIIKELFLKNKIKTKKIAFSLSNGIIVKKLSCPKYLYEKSNTGILKKIISDLNLNPDEFNLEKKVINYEKDQVNLLCFIARRNILSQYLTTIEEAGLTPSVVDIDQLALENTIEFNYQIETDENIMIVSIGTNKTLISIISKGKNIFVGSIYFGGNTYTDEIRKKLNLKIDEAENLKLSVNLKSFLDTTEAITPLELGGVIREINTKFANDFKIFIEQEETLANLKFDKIYISGGASKIPGISETLGSFINTKVYKVNPFLRLSYDKKKFDSEMLENLGPMAGVAIGLALRKET